MFGFLLKCVIIAVVFLLVYPDLQPVLAPSTPERPADAVKAPAAPGLDAAAGSALGVVRAAVSDAAGFCDRQPDACARASVVVDALGDRLGQGASALAETLSSATPREGATPPPPAPTDTTAGDPARGTLTDADLAARWSVDGR